MQINLQLKLVTIPSTFGYRKQLSFHKHMLSSFISPRLVNAKTLLMKFPRLLNSSELFFVCPAESAVLGLQPHMEQVESED